MITSLNRPSVSLQSGFTYFTGANKCPVCGEGKDCRQSKETQLIHCHGSVDNPNYIARGQDAHGFQMFASVKDAEEFKNRNREEWLEDLARKNEAKAESKRLKAASSQPIASRHRDIEAILSQLSLSASDRKRLNDRGMSDDYIDEIGYVSAKQWQRLEGSLRYGMSSRGTLKNPVDCILVPIRNIDGKYTCLKLYNYDTQNNDFGKYTWIQGASHLHETGELPLAVYNLSAQSRTVGLVEGMEIKPVIAAKNLDMTIIGVGGSNWASSPEELKKILAHCNPAEVVLFPDAGMLKNKDIIASYLKTVKEVQSLGYPVKLAWWGQFEKSNGDIDEIDVATTHIRYLSWDEYTSQTDDAAKLFVTNLANRILSAEAKKKAATADKPYMIGVPSKMEWQGEAIAYQEGEGVETIQKVFRSLGKKHILCTSGTGTGKTHMVDPINQGINACFVHTEGEEDQFHRLFYTSPSPRNVNSEAIAANAHELIGKHIGHFHNYDKMTAAGRAYREPLTDPENTPDELITPSNCHWATKFFETNSNSHSTKGFCKTCPFFEKCGKEVGIGYGARFQALENLKKQYVSGHITAIPDDTLSAFDLLVLDEASTFPWTREVLIKPDDLLKTIAAIKSFNLALYKDLSPVFLQLNGLFAELKGGDKMFGRHAIASLALLDLSDEDKRVIEDNLEAVKLAETSMMGSPNEILLEGKAVPTRFLRDLLAVIIGKKNGSIGTSEKAIKLIVANERVQGHAKSGCLTLALDATLTKEDYALMLGVDPSEIVEVFQLQPKVNNVIRTQLIGCGKFPNIRSEAQNKRASDLKAYYVKQIKEQGVKIGFIEHKAHAIDGLTQLNHGGDARGSNLYEDYDEILIFGQPLPNFGDVLHRYNTLKGVIVGGDDKEFDAYYHRQVKAGVQQEEGRLRANRRPDQIVKITYVGDGNIDRYLDDDQPITKIDMSIEHPEFCDSTTATKARKMHAFWQFAKEKTREVAMNVSQNGFAKYLGESPQNLSQYVKRHFEGSFKLMKEVFMAAFEPTPTPDEELGQEGLGAVNYTTNFIATCGLESLTDRQFNEQLKIGFGSMNWKWFIEAIKRSSITIGARFLFRLVKAVMNPAEYDLSDPIMEYS